MNNELIKSTADAISIGRMMYESGLFADIKSASQAVVKILAGQEVGVPPLASMTGIHVISGKTVVGAGLMASRVKGSGKYDYLVTEHTDKVCSIEFKQGKNVLGISTFTIDDAKKAGTKNLDKFPRNMLFARAMSNGVKWFTPDIYSMPVYVPEEMDTTPQEVEVIKPSMSEAQWEKLRARVEGGEYELIERAQSKFALSEEQQTTLSNIINAKENA